VHGATTLYELFEESVRKHGDRPCLGWRPMTDGKAGPFEFWTYKETRGEHSNEAGPGSRKHHGFCCFPADPHIHHIMIYRSTRNFFAVHIVSIRAQ
jgi:hypothetical protein